MENSPRSGVALKFVGWLFVIVLALFFAYFLVVFNLNPAKPVDVQSGLTREDVFQNMSQQDAATIKKAITQQPSAMTPKEEAQIQKAITQQPSAMTAQEESQLEKVMGLKK